MNSESKVITDNLPFIIGLQYAYVEDFNDNMTLKSGKSWNSIPFTKRSATSQTKSKASNGGTLFETSIKFRISKDDLSTTTDLQYLSNRFIIVRETDANKTVRIVGSKNLPASLEYGISKTGFNGYDCEISCTDITPPNYE